MGSDSPSRHPFKFAYVSRLRYPDGAANALQTFRMAVALSHRLDTTLFVHDLELPEADLFAHYGVGVEPLKIQSLHTGRWPRFVSRRGRWRYLTYNGLVALLLGIRRQWRSQDSAQHVLFVRSHREIIFWGLRHRFFPWLRRWIFACELHDLLVPFDPATGAVPAQHTQQAQQVIQALQNYDEIIVMTRILAEDLQKISQGKLNPHVISLCSGLPRLTVLASSPIETRDVVTLGYIGTVDLMRGTDAIFEALRWLPDNFHLHIVGRIQGQQTDNEFPDWLAELLDQPEIAAKVSFTPQIPYDKIAREIDACDIVLLPAGTNIHAARYAAPLKLFDYMARGKPIVAADVPAHIELLQDGVNARLYQAGNAEHLAAVLRELAGDPGQMQAIARRAWEQSDEFTYEARAKRILELVEQAWKKKSTI